MLKEESLNIDKNNYSDVIKNNISRYLSWEDFFSEDFDSFSYSPLLDEESIKKNYREFLFNAWETPINWDSFHNWFLLYSWEDYNNIKNIIFTRNITPELQKHIYLFLQSFIDYCNELSWEELKQFSWEFYNIFLSWSPNIFSCLTNEYKFLIISQLLKNDELHNIRSNFTWEFHYQFVFSDKEWLDRLLEEIDKWGEISAINSLNMLSIVISDLWWYAEENLANNIKYICERIFAKYNNPFFRYKVKALLKDVDYMILNDFPPISRNDLTRTNNVEFEGDNNWYTVKIASDYVSSISAMWYSKALSNYEWKEDESNNSSLNDTYEFYNFIEKSYKILENMHIDLSQNDAARIYSYMDKMYYNQIDANDTYLKEICINLLWDDSWNRLYDIFILSIEERKKQNEVFNDFVEKAWEEYENPMNSPEYNLIYEKLNNWLNNFLNNKIFSEISNIFNSTHIIKQESNQVSLKGNNYNEVLSSSDVNIYGYIDIENYSIFMQEMHTPEMIYMINNDLWINITNLTLQNQVYLLRFLWEKTTEEFDKFKETLDSIQNEEDKYTFLKTFLACSKSPEIGNKILELTQKEWAINLFRAYSNLIDIQNEAPESLDIRYILSTVLIKWEQLLLEAYASDEIKIDKKYEKELVKSWAFVKALFESSWKDEIMNMSEFNESSSDFKIAKFSCWDLIKETDSVSMLMAENYTSPEFFWVADYKMLISNIQETYQNISPKVIELLVEWIKKDLQDPSVDLYTMRKKNWEIIAICKIQKINETEAYWWTHYVNPEFRWNFWIWSYLAKLAFKDNKDLNIKASVVKNNTNLEAQVNHSDFVWTELIDVFNNLDKNDFVIWIKNYKDITFKTKSHWEYPNDKLKNLIWDNWNFRVYKCDSSPWVDGEYIDILENEFRDWNVMTRIFYEKNWKNADLQNTYIVFENYQK